MSGQRLLGGSGATPARTVLHWVACVTLAWLVLAERFADLLPAVAAFAGAAWVFGLERRGGSH